MRKDGSRFWARGDDHRAARRQRRAHGLRQGDARHDRAPLRARAPAALRRDLRLGAQRHLHRRRRRGGYLGANAAFLRLLGINEAELRSRSIFDVTHPDDVAETRRAFHEMVTARWTGSSSRSATCGSDGSPVWVRVTAAAIADAEGVATRVVAQVEDITERRAAAERARRERAALPAAGRGRHRLRDLHARPRRARSRAGTRAPSASRATRRPRCSAGTSRCSSPPRTAPRGKPERALETARASGRFADEGWRAAQGRQPLLGARWCSTRCTTRPARSSASRRSRAT